MPSLLHAAAVLAGLTIFIYALMTALGIYARSKGQLSAEYARTKTGTPPPDWIGNAGRNFINLCEAPVLFYALVAFHYAASVPIDGFQLQLGWAFVALRILHSAVHVTINNMGLRFLLHRIGIIVLAVMWVRFALAV